MLIGAKTIKKKCLTSMSFLSETDTFGTVILLVQNQRLYKQKQTNYYFVIVTNVLLKKIQPCTLK